MFENEENIFSCEFYTQIVDLYKIKVFGTDEVVRYIETSTYSAIYSLKWKVPYYTIWLNYNLSPSINNIKQFKYVKESKSNTEIQDAENFFPNFQ